MRAAYDDGGGDDDTSEDKVRVRGEGGGEETEGGAAFVVYGASYMCIRESVAVSVRVSYAVRVSADVGAGVRMSLCSCVDWDRTGEIGWLGEWED